MSIWGHVAGVIRVNGRSVSLTEEVYVPPTTPPVDIGVMSPEYDYNATANMTEEQEKDYFKIREMQWKASEDSGIPMGSEGSLKWSYSCHKIGDCQYHGNYTISGDLRDFEEADVVYNWLKQVKAKVEAVPGCWLRQVAVQVEIEGKEPVFIGLVYNEQTREDELIKYTVAANGVLIYAKN